MERKKRSKGSVWEFCYANKIFGTCGFEIRACGQKLVKFCTLTHIHTTAAKLVVRVIAITITKRKTQSISRLGNTIRNKKTPNHCSEIMLWGTKHNNYVAVLNGFDINNILGNYVNSNLIVQKDVAWQGDGGRNTGRTY